MKMRKLVGVIGLSIFWTGCASTSPLSSPEKWQNFNQSAAISTQDLAEDHAMVIFIREPNTIAGSAVNIFVEGEYLTSLQSGGYKAVSLCAMPTNITAAYTDIDLNYPSLREQKNAFDLTRSGIHYFSVAQAENNQLHLKPLTEQQAQQAMQTVQEQVNTLPRLGKNRVCPKVVYQQVQAPEPVIKKYSLAASTLFAYSKSGSQDLLPQGRKEITEIANEIKNNQVQIGHVAVIGYTDPVGSEEFNQQLSLRRAETVRGLLTHHGLFKQNILVEGRGEYELVVSDCDIRFATNKLARNKCNEPNRRVEIVTFGLKGQ